jgi:hypothetical protein
MLCLHKLHECDSNTKGMKAARKGSEIGVGA